MSVKIQLRRDSAANWTSGNPTLSQGEIGFETDTKKFKIGDGTTAWTSLTYFSMIGTMAEFDTACTNGNFAFAGGAFHDGFSDFVANEHIDWTSDQGATNIHKNNLADSGNWDTAYTHSQDNTQAHSDYLLNSEADVGVGLTLTGDNSSADTQYTAQVLYNTDATPPAASGFPVGTIYIQYTP
jgi:hypothetical protein